MFLIKYFYLFKKNIYLFFFFYLINSLFPHVQCCIFMMFLNMYFKIRMELLLEIKQVFTKFMYAINIM